MDNDFLQVARQQDRQDPLADMRDRFYHDHSDTIYLDGNSLGRMPATVTGTMAELLEQQWGCRLIRSWNENWMELPRTVAGKLAQLLGADPDEILLGDSTSINLYKLAFAALKYQENRNRIITDSLNFPTDRYVLDGLVRHQFPRHQLITVDSHDDMTIHPEAVNCLLDTDTALLTFSHVAYKSAFLHDMHKINEMAHRMGALVLWDLSHSAGAVPIHLNETGTDLAVGCTYKYLNGGPGAPAFLYVRKDLQSKLHSPIQGWFGHQRPFDFARSFEPAADIQRFAAGTPHVLSLMPVLAGIDTLLGAGMDQLREKSLGQTQFLLKLFHEWLRPLGFRLGSPEAAEMRGSHITLRHPDGYRINQAMIRPEKSGNPVVIPDFRPPDNIRLGIAPLYISYEDIYRAVKRIREIVASGEFQNFSGEISGVT